MLKRERKLGRGVAMVGAGLSQFGAFADKTSRDLFAEAYTAMLASVDRGLDPRDIEALYIGNFAADLSEGQGHLAPIMAEWTGLLPRPATRVEDACASSGVAFREGVIAIASGLYDIVLVGGVEKITSLPTERVTDTLAMASDAIYEIPAGFTFPGIFASIATAHMHAYGTREEHFMAVGMKNHHNGALNPHAHLSSTIRQIMEVCAARAKARSQPAPSWASELAFLRDQQANPLVAWPMRLYDCAPLSDGAACVLLAAEEIASSLTATPIRIIGSGQASGPPLHSSAALTTLSASRAAAETAYKMALVGPRDIKVAEVHDCFTIGEIVATEDLGFFPQGRGGFAATEGMTGLNGARPINTSGGLKARGHAVGATGVAQAVEVWHQLRGEAGPRQVRDGTVDLALTHNVGGTGGTCVVHIFEGK